MIGLMNQVSAVVFVMALIGCLVGLILSLCGKRFSKFLWVSFVLMFLSFSLFIFINVTAETTGTPLKLDESLVPENSLLR